MIKYADVRITIRVRFEDDGENALVDQAMDAATDASSFDGIVGEPEYEYIAAWTD